MYRLQDWAAVQRVYKQTHSIRETARILKISRNTVKKLLAMKEEPKYNRTIYKSCLDVYKEQIIEWRCEPFEFNGTRIFKELRKRGYTGSIGPVCAFLSIRKLFCNYPDFIPVLSGRELQTDSSAG